MKAQPRMGQAGQLRMEVEAVDVKSLHKLTHARICHAVLHRSRYIGVGVLLTWSNDNLTARQQ
jgi:hypothetical protein